MNEKDAYGRVGNLWLMRSYLENLNELSAAYSILNCVETRGKAASCVGGGFLRGGYQLSSSLMLFLL